MLFFCSPEVRPISEKPYIFKKVWLLLLTLVLPYVIIYGKEVRNMAIVKYRNQSGVEYAYEQISVYDAERKQSRPVKKYLGRVDPETGEIIKTTGKRGRPRKDPKENEKGAGGAGENDYRALYDMKSREVESLKKELAKTAEERDRLSVQLSELKQVITVIRAQVSSVKDL